MEGHLKMWLGVGVIAIIGGFFALVDPLRTLDLQIESLKVTLEYFVGWLFLLIGAAIAVLGLSPRHTISWRLVPIGVALFCAGLLVLVNPAAGAMIITLLLALALIVSGTAKAVLGWEMRPGHATWWIMAAGVVSFVVGLFVLLRFPASANLTLGVFLPIDMIATGAMMVVLAFWHRDHKT